MPPWVDVTVDGDRRGTALVLVGGLGDTVRALPVAVGLAAAGHPPSWLLPPASARLLADHPALDRVVPYHRKEGRAGHVKLWRDARSVRPERVLNLERYLKGALPALMLGGRRWGLDRPHAREGSWLLHHERVRVDTDVHERELFTAFLDRLDVPVPDPTERHLSPTAEERETRVRFFARLGGSGPVVGLVLASGRPGKDWPVERSAELARRLVREIGARVVLVGGPSGREEEAADTVRRAEPAAVDARADDARRLVWLLDGCDACVAPDTGPLLVAAEVGTPVIGLYGATNPWRVGPVPLDTELIIDRYTRPHETPGPAHGGHRGGNLRRIEVDEVLERVVLALGRSDGA